MAAVDRFLNSWNNIRKIIKIEKIDAIIKVLEAAASLSNCPPYSTRYPSGKLIFFDTACLISFTTPLKSLSITLADITSGSG